jgi:pimeloyl-ACP methyl ester carboxylesterase
MSVRVACLTAALGVLASGCITSYADRGALPYREVPYTSADGAEWPERYVPVPEAVARYGLPDDTNVCYVELNPTGAQTLVFVHGLGSYLKFWRHQLDAFAAQGYRVIAVDMIGYGKSDKPGSFPYTTEAMGDVLLEVLEAAAVKSPVLVGHSMGGQIALSLAIRHPTRMEAIVLTAPAGFEKFSRREIAWFDSVFSVALVKSAGEEAIWGSIRYNNFFRWRKELEWLIEERVRAVGNPDFDQYAYANVRSVQGLARNQFVRDNLDKVSVPTLIVHGDMDRLIPNRFMHGGTTRAIMEYGHGRIRGSKLVSLSGCGHSLQLDCPQEYNAAVTAFLREELGAGAGR